MIDRDGLADFLRRRRELLRPADVGLPDGARRRAPGPAPDHFTNVPVHVCTDLGRCSGRTGSPSSCTARTASGGGSRPRDARPDAPEDHARLSASHARDLRAVHSRRAGEAE